MLSVSGSLVSKYVGYESEKESERVGTVEGNSASIIEAETATVGEVLYIVSLRTFEMSLFFIDRIYRCNSLAIEPVYDGIANIFQ